MSDYRDDRGALRSRNAELEQELDAERAERERAAAELAEKERELRELRVRVGNLPEPSVEDAPVFPQKRVAPRLREKLQKPMRPREIDPRVLEEMRGAAERVPGPGRPIMTVLLVVALLIMVGGLYSERQLIHPTKALAAILVLGAMVLVVVGWPKKK